jgi:hypothetical protein
LGHGALPAAKSAQASRMPAASRSCAGFRVAGTGVFGKSNRYCNSELCVAIGGRNPGGVQRWGALSSLNSYA